MGDSKQSVVEDVESMMGQLEKILDKLKTGQDEKSFPGELPHRVIHLKNNPMQMAMRQKEQEFEALKKENERLKARLELLETGNASDVTRRIDEVVDSSRHIDSLNKKIEELKQRETKILDQFRRTSREFREVSYLLTGYKMSALKNRIYVMSNMYAEREEDKLFFEISPDGQLKLLKNEFSDRLTDFVETYLERADSFPAFLSAINLDLFKSSTQYPQDETVDRSVTMSTTILPNSNYNP